MLFPIMIISSSLAVYDIYRGPHESWHDLQLIVSVVFNKNWYYCIPRLKASNFWDRSLPVYFENVSFNQTTSLSRKLIMRKWYDSSSLNVLLWLCFRFSSILVNGAQKEEVKFMHCFIWVLASSTMSFKRG